MNLPVTSPVVTNVFLDQLMPDKLFVDLVEKNFTGYTYLTIETKNRFEESIIIMSKGKVVGSIYLITSYEIELYGKDAFEYCLNSFGSKNGVLNIYSLTDDQIKLILLFNDKIKYTVSIIKKNKKNKELINKINYDEVKFESLIKNKLVLEQQDNQKDVLDRFGLDDLLDE